MLELVEKYFNEDLTEAEDQILNESLASSDEAASQFMELAEKAYYGFGLPEPHWPGTAPSGVPPAVTTFGGPWLGPLGVVTGIAILGFLGYHYCRVHGQLAGLMPEKPVSEITQKITKAATAAKIINPSTGAISPQTRALSGAAAPNAVIAESKKAQNVVTAPGANPVAAYTGGAGLDKIPVKTSAEKPDADSVVTAKPGTFEKSPPSADVPIQGNKSSSEAVPARVSQASPAQPAVVKPSARAPVATPMAWDESNSKSYSNLSVMVEQPVLGFVTVQVLDANGGQAALLYRGNLNPGKWVFEWDGKMGGTLPAPSGYYFIQLQSGSQVMRKKIQIH